MADLEITEGLSGLWHYHLSDSGSLHRGLCGAPTMRTAMRLSSWKVQFGEHFVKRPTWCAKCDAMKEEKRHG